MHFACLAQGGKQTVNGKGLFVARTVDTVYLGNGSAKTSFRATTLRWELQIQLVCYHRRVTDPACVLSQGPAVQALTPIAPEGKPVENNNTSGQ